MTPCRDNFFDTSPDPVPFLLKKGTFTTSESPPLEKLIADLILRLKGFNAPGVHLYAYMIAQQCIVKK